MISTMHNLANVESSSLECCYILLFKVVLVALLGL